jgi:hypothetical protein
MCFFVVGLIIIVPLSSTEISIDDPSLIPISLDKETGIRTAKLFPHF